MNDDQQEAQRLRDVALGIAAAGLAGYTQRGVDPTIVRDELLSLIEHAVHNAPRSLQQTIGPSEIGTECDRKLAFKLLQKPAARVMTASWRATVGTAVHAWLADRLTAANQASGIGRWLVETRVNVGTIADDDCYGSCDAYDVLSAGVLDWKIVGPTSLRKYKNGPGRQYRSQVHTYGNGIRALGLPVDWVGIFFLPSNGELHDGVFWHEPHDPAVAQHELDRATQIKRALSLVGEALLPALQTADAPCAYCPWLNSTQAAAHPGSACAGHPLRATRNDPLFALAGKKTA